MYNDSIQVSFKGFLPGFHLQSQAALVADRIQNSAPSDSFIQIHLHQVEIGSYHCQIRLISLQARIVEEFTCSQPGECLIEVAENVMQEIEEWKSHRLFPQDDYPKQLNKVV